MTIIQQIHVIALSVIHERLQILFRLRQKLQSLQLALEGYFHLNGETTKKPPKKLVFGAMTTRPEDGQTIDLPFQFAVFSFEATPYGHQEVGGGIW